MAGFAGAGKTTFATTLNQKLLQWEMLNKDTFKQKRLARGEEEEQAGWYAFEDLLRLIKEKSLNEGKSAIIDTSNERPFVFQYVLQALQEIAPDQLHSRLKIILCLASKSIRTKRIARRGSVFAPYVQSLPTILDDTELPERFHHFLADYPDLLTKIEHLATHQEDLERFAAFSCGNVLILNTNIPLERYSDETWRSIGNFLQYDIPLAEHALSPLEPLR
jgi:predicted kinase